MAKLKVQNNLVHKGYDNSNNATVIYPDISSNYLYRAMRLALKEGEKIIRKDV